jgi:dihydroorotase
MPATSRREFLALAGSASALALSASGLGPGLALAAMGPNDKFDLLVKGGEVLDPSQNLRAKRDVGIRYGVIEALEANIPADKALKVLNASGKLVTPGLIDLHAHVFPYGSAIGIPADELLSFQGTKQRRRLSPRHRRPDAGPPLRLRAHRQHRPCRLPGA